jgi:hypothetical protein
LKTHKEWDKGELMNTEEYSNEFLRGISSTDYVSNGQVLYTAFKFDVIPDRNDHMLESSINWLDDDGAIEEVLNQRKDNGKIQFSAGAAKLNLDTVKLFFTNIPKDAFSYERAVVPGNAYHGNLLLSESCDKNIRHLIMNGLALAAGTSIIPQTNT